MNTTRFIAACLGALLLFLIVKAAMAAGTTATVTIVPPTLYEDGTALPATDIAFYTISWSGAGPSGSKQTTTLVTSVPVACGSVSFTATVTTTAGAKYPNATSLAGGPVPYAAGVTCVPNAPGLSVQ
jgi:hypothetical protein